MEPIRASGPNAPSAASHSTSSGPDQGRARAEPGRFRETIGDPRALRAPTPYDRRHRHGAGAPGPGAGASGDVFATAPPRELAGRARATRPGETPALAEGSDAGGTSARAAGGRLDSETRDAAEARTPDRDEGPVDPLDPSTRQAAHLGLLGGALGLGVGGSPDPTSSPAGSLAAAHASLEEMFPDLVRRIAWTGDRRRGTVQLELGRGAYAGTTITVHADDGRVRVDVRGAGRDDAELARLRERLDDRLRRKGIDVETT